eukprot:764698-Hanusia_phi.AAC.1
MAQRLVLALLLTCLVSSHVDMLAKSSKHFAHSLPQPAMVLRGGLSDFGLDEQDTEIVLEDEEDSSEIIGEGTTAPGPGVQVEQGYMEKKREEIEYTDIFETIHSALEMIQNCTIEDASRLYEEQRREFPDGVVDPSKLFLFEVRRGNLSVVKDLLDQGVSVDHRNSVGDSALHLAVLENRVRLREVIKVEVKRFCAQTEMMELLMERGAGIDAMNKKRNTALHLAAELNN